MPSLWSAMKRTAVSSIAPTMRKLHSESRTPNVVELCIAFSGYQRKPPEEQLLWGKAKVGFCPLQAASLQILEAGTVALSLARLPGRELNAHS